MYIHIHIHIYIHTYIHAYIDTHTHAPAFTHFLALVLEHVRRGTGQRYTIYYIPAQQIHAYPCTEAYKYKEIRVN